MSLWKWLGLERAADAQEFDSLTGAETVLKGLDAATRRYVACFAYILTRSARADHQVTDGEELEMERILATHTGIPDALAAAVVRFAGIQARRSGGTDDFVVTREFDRVASHEQKVALIDALFTVSSVDASIVTIEDNEIRRIAKELKIEHTEYIAVRARHLEHLQVLKQEEPKRP
jgi:uncharacterized tellurite resistance protein B-like protein